MPIEILPENNPDWMQFDDTDDILFLGEDAFWQTKAGAANPDQAILFRGGLGFFERSTDGGKTWASVLGPASHYPPWFTPGDITWHDVTYHTPDSSIPRPTKYQITYRSYASNPAYTGEHAVLASYVVTDGVDTNWDLAPMWILYTFDDWTTSAWQQLVNEGWSAATDGSGLSFGAEYEPDTCTYGHFGLPGYWSSHRAVVRLTPFKAVGTRMRIDDGGSPCGDATIEGCVIDIAGQAITFGPWYALGPANTYMQETGDVVHKSIEVDNNSFVTVEAGLVLGALPNEWEFWVAASSVAGTLITQGTPVLLENHTSPEVPFRDTAVAKLADGKVVVASYSWDTINAYVCNVAGNTVTPGTAQPITTGGGEIVQMCALSSTKIICVYGEDWRPDTELYARVGTVSGLNISWGSAQKFSVGAITAHRIIDNSLDCIGLDSTHFAVSWGESDRSTPYTDWTYVRIGSVSGSVITFGSATLLDTPTASNPPQFISLEKFNAEKLLVYYMLDESPYDVTCKIGTVTGTSVSFGNAIVDDSVGTNYFSQVKMLDASSGTCLIWADDGSSFDTSHAQIINGMPYEGYLVESFGALQQIGDQEHAYLSGYLQIGSRHTATRLSETKVVLSSVYQDGSANTQIQVWIADISGDTITEGSKYNIGTFEWNTPRNHKIVAIDSNTFLCIWLDYDPVTYNGWTALIQAGTVSGKTISLGNTLNWDTQFGTGGSRYATWADTAVCRMSNYRAIVAMDAYMSHVSISGNTTAWMSGTEYQPSTDNNGLSNIARITDTKFILAFQSDAVPYNNRGRAIIGDVSGSALSFGSEYDFNFDTANYCWHVDVCGLTDSTFAVVWKEPLGGGIIRLLTRVGSVSGTVINFGAYTTVHTPHSSSYQPYMERVHRLDDNNYFISFWDSYPDIETFNIATVSENNAVWLYNGPWVPGGIADSVYTTSCVLSTSKALAWRIEDDCVGYDCYATAYIINLLGGESGITTEGGDISERYYAGAMSFTTNGEHLWIPGLSRVQTNSTFKLVADWLQRNPGSTYNVISYANWGESGKYPRYYGWEIYGDSLSRAQAISGEFFVHLAPWPYSSTGLIAFGNMQDDPDLYLVATHYSMVFNDAWADRASDVSVSHVIWIKTASGEEVRAAHYFGGRIYALLNTSTGSELWESSLPPYTGGSNFTHKSDSIIDAAGDNAMDIDERDGTIVIANDAADLLIVASTPSPYTVWYNFTLSHKNDRGVTGLIVL